MADKSILVRYTPVPSQQTELPEGLTSQLAHDAKQVLGYDIYQKEVGKASLELDCALAELGIQQFQPETVERYQKAFLEEKRQEDQRPRRKFALLSILLLVIGAPMLIFALDTNRPFSPFGLIGSILCLGSFCSFMFMPDSMYFEWTRTPLNNYKEQIPIHVIQRAVSLKEKLPEVQFEVVHIAAMRRLDPFLLANYHGRKAWIDAWEEPKFEAEVF